MFAKKHLYYLAVMKLNICEPCT